MSVYYDPYSLPPALTRDWMTPATWLNYDRFLKYPGSSADGPVLDPYTLYVSSLHARHTRGASNAPLSYDTELNLFTIHTGLSEAEALPRFQNRQTLIGKVQSQVSPRSLGLYGGFPELFLDQNWGKTWRDKARRLIKLHYENVSGYGHIEPVAYLSKEPNATIEGLLFIQEYLRPSDRKIWWRWTRVMGTDAPVPPEAHKTLNDILAGDDQWLFFKQQVTPTQEDQDRVDEMIGLA